MTLGVGYKLQLPGVNMWKKKTIQRFVLLFLIVVLILIDFKLVLADSDEPSHTPEINTQEIINNSNESTGNQSDITGPDAHEMMNSNNDQSDGNDTPISSIDRGQFDKQFAEANTTQAIDKFEAMQALEYSQYLGLTLYGKTASSADISKTLTDLSEKTGEKSALVYLASLENQLQSIMIPPNTNNGGNKSVNKGAIAPSAGYAIAQNSDQIVRQVVPEASRQNLR
ncbi:MAG TPA: hypothetical protein V6C58_07980, partial [Allocoleopsis sp.]